MIDTSGDAPLGQACLSHSKLRFVWNLFSALLLALLCTACHQPAKEHVLGSIVIDGRTWDPIRKSAPRKGVDVTLEFLPQGQIKNNWNEMLTVQFFATPEGKVSVNSFVSTYLLKLQNDTASDGTTRSNAIKSRIILKDTDMITFAWQGDVRAANLPGMTANGQPGNSAGTTTNVQPGISPATTSNVQPRSAGVPLASAMPETDIVRAYSADDGMHVVQYATKGTMSPAVEQHWVQRINRTDLDNLVRPELEDDHSQEHQLPGR